MTAAHASPHWVDIVAPAAPPGTAATSVLMFALILVIAIALVLAFLYRRRPGPRAKRALRRIGRELRAARIETRDACFGIRSCLRHGFGHQELARVPWDAQADWQRYLGRLERCCFACEPPSAAVPEELIRDAIAWLDKKRSSTDALAHS